MPEVELVWDADCPNVREARANLWAAFGALGVPARWTEWDRADPAAPAHARAFGSPAILIDGRDAAGLSAQESACCRVYESAGRIAPAPPVDTIVSALRAAGVSPGSTPDAGRARDGGWSLAALPSVAIALLPKVTCPACWPLYAGALSALGLGFLLEVTWLLPITLGLLSIALLVLGRGAARRRGFGPLALGCLASALLVIGKFTLDSEPAMYAGAAALFAATVWNAWPLPRPTTTGSCPACVPDVLETGKGG